MHIMRRSVRFSLVLLLVPAMLLGTPVLVEAGTQFLSATNYDLGVSLLRVGAGDYSGDEVIDIVVTPPSSNWYTTACGTGTGTFTFSAEVCGTTGAPGSIAFGLFNDDEDLDMALACPGNNCVAVHINDGAGGFIGASSSSYPTNSTPVWVAAGDLNDDGYDDLVTANSGDDSVTVLMNDQDGTFTDTNYTVFVGGPTVQPSAIALGDFDGDGDLDIAVALRLNQSFRVMFNNGAGSFSVTQESAGLAPESIVSADFNDDGYYDVAVANYLADSSDNSVCVWLGGGGASHTDFVGPDWYSVGDYLTSIAAGDFNADGTPDLAVADEDDDRVSVLLGDGAGDFAAPDNYAVGEEPVCVVAADFNSDGACDLATANDAGHSMSVLLSRGSASTTRDLDLNLEAGWNMVSVPLTLDPEANTPDDVFPDAEAVYAWDPATKSYVVPTTIVPERSYWVAVTEADIVTVRSQVHVFTNSPLTVTMSASVTATQ